MINPLTGMPTVAAFTMLVNHIGGLVNQHRRGPDEWTVSSELSLELAPDALALIAGAPEVPVIATGRPCGRKGPTLTRVVRTQPPRLRCCDRDRALVLHLGPLPSRRMSRRPDRSSAPRVTWATGWRFGSPRA